MTSSILRKNEPVREGVSAPDFSLVSDKNERVRLSDLRGKNVVLYFYPKDDTPGCTIEARDFSAALDKFEKAGATVLGVSKDSLESHCKFRDKYKLKFGLLSDPELSAHNAYGVWGEKNMYGKKILGTIRSTFLIGKDGKIARVFSPVKVDGHAAAVLAALKGEAPAEKKKTAVKVPAKAAAPKKAVPSKSVEKSVAKKPAAKKGAAKR